MAILDTYKSAEQRRQIVTEVTEAILRGDSVREIEVAYAKAYGFTEEYVRTVLIPCTRREIAKTTGQQAQHIVPMHIELYEQIYKFFDEHNQASGKLKAMLYKEKLMGLHKTNNTIEINNKKTTIIEKNFTYDTNKLSNQEKERLSELLNKTKK